jgi:hypothetical protein
MLIYQFTSNKAGNLITVRRLGWWTSVFLILVGTASLHAGEERRIDLTSVTANEGLNEWVMKVRDVVDTLYFQFYEKTEFTLDPDGGTPIHDLADGDELAFLRSTLVAAPNGELSLNTFVLNVEKTETGWCPYRLSPDKHVYLFDDTSSAGWPVLHFGPSDTSIWAGWVDESTFIVFAVIPDVRTARLNVWRVTVEWPKIRRERFLGPAVDSGQQGVLEREWEAWLKKRFPTVVWSG